MSRSESTVEICTVRGASKGIGSDRTGEAVEAAGPIGGGTVRTSFLEDKVTEEGSLDIRKVEEV